MEWKYEDYLYFTDGLLARYLSMFGIHIKVIRLTQSTSLYLVPQVQFVSGLIDEYEKDNIFQVKDNEDEESKEDETSDEEIVNANLVC